MLQLGDNDLRGPFVFPFPKDAADQAKLDGLHYRNALEQLSERFHTTPQTIVALIEEQAGLLTAARAVVLTR